MHAIGWLVLQPLLPNIQTSRVKMGSEGTRICLQSGANDLGGTLMEESVTRAAGRVPLQRTTLYGMVGEASSATAPEKAGASSPLLQQLH
jgi:FO synthase